MRIIRLEEVDSTNTYVSRHASELESGCVVVAECQTAGRGQRGNSWESEPGKNITFTMLLRPNAFLANRQFSISEAVSLSIVEALREMCGVDAKVKWPNDIYVGDKKLAGILIEHAIMGREIMHTIVGVGLNVNQNEFKSDAPNPISLCQILGETVDCRLLMEHVCNRIESKVAMLTEDDAKELIHRDFLTHLWRNDGGEYLFRDVASSEIYSGKIDDVEMTGHILIRRIDESRSEMVHRYAFKEVEWIID